MTSSAMLCLCLLGVHVVAVLVVCAWFLARCMAGKAEEEEESGPHELPRGRRDASGLWVVEGGGAGEQERPERTHPLYKKLAGLSTEVGAMSRGQLKQRLRELNMEPRLVQYDRMLCIYQLSVCMVQRDRYYHQQTPHDLPT